MRFADAKPRMRLPVRPNSSARGFTLIELMITVVIMAVLATVAVYGVTRYIAQAKTSEATRMLGDIKSAQEEYKNEHGSYLDVTGDLATFYPTNPDPGQVKVAWGAGGTIGAKFQALSVNAAGPVLFQYACSAGTATEIPDAVGSDITIGNWPSAAIDQPWYAVKAVADLRKGGYKTVYVAASFTNQIFSAHEGE